MPKGELRKCESQDADWDFPYLKIPAEAPNLRAVSEEYPSNNRGTGCQE